MYNGMLCIIDAKKVQELDPKFPQINSTVYVLN